MEFRETCSFRNPYTTCPSEWLGSVPIPLFAVRGPRNVTYVDRICKRCKPVFYMAAKRGDYYVELVTWLAPCRIKLFVDIKCDDRFTTAFLLRAVTGVRARSAIAGNICKLFSVPLSLCGLFTLWFYGHLSTLASFTTNVHFLLWLLFLFASIT
jgi:hypothetical protein